MVPYEKNPNCFPETNKFKPKKPLEKGFPSNDSKQTN